MISLLSDGEDEGVDLHSGEFCVDVSTFGDIVFENQGREACDTTFERVCETKTEQVSQVERQFCTYKNFILPYDLAPKSRFMP